MKTIEKQFKYAAVCSRDDKENPGKKYYDIWTWNVWKLKWTRMSQHGSGFWELKYAEAGALAESDKIETMLLQNQNGPAPFK